jgi:hypothetical protein
MTTNLLKQGAFTENTVGLGTVTRKMVRERAVQLAAINGRAAHETTKSDLEQARLELTGRESSNANETALDSATESDRWNPVLGSTGGMTETSSSEDEDDEGRSDNELLVNEGLAAAENEQMRQATTT